MMHNILVVDDEPKLCDLLASALGQNEVQVFVAGNGLHALKVLEQEDIDLVISDWRMPGMDGPALLAEIKVRYPQVPVIVMTAYSTVKNRYCTPCCTTSATITTAIDPAHRQSPRPCASPSPKVRRPCAGDGPR